MHENQKKELLKMLVLSRKLSERILIGDDIAIMVIEIRPGVVRIGIDAPKTVKIVREELVAKDGEPK